MTQYRAFVTGATGFIGRHLVSSLVKDGWKVDALIREKGRSLPPSSKMNITQYFWDNSTQGLLDILENAKPDIVFHLASCFIAQHTSSQVDDLINSNVLLGTQLAEAMSAAGVSRMVNFGTSWQHYQNQNYSPVCLYAATKQAFETILQYYVEARQLNVITLKVYDTLGIDDDRNKLFPTLMKVATTGETLQLSLGEQCVDFIHVTDVIRAALIAADNLLTRSSSGMSSYGLGSGSPVSLRKFVELVEEVIGRPLNIVWGGRPYRDREVMTPWDGGNRLPGWEPQYTLKQAIEESASEYV